MHTIRLNLARKNQSPRPTLVGEAPGAMIEVHFEHLAIWSFDEQKRAKTIFAYT